MTVKSTVFHKVPSGEAVVGSPDELPIMLIRSANLINLYFSAKIPDELEDAH